MVERLPRDLVLSEERPKGGSNTSPSCVLCPCRLAGKVRTPQIDGAGLALPQTRSEFYPLKCAEVSAIRQEVRTCVESLCPCSGRFQPRAEGQYRKYGCLKLLMSYFDQLRIDDSPCLFLLCWKT
ncbi:hypothetical protein Y1Q_0002711 [Alligator mississippiensis]|uniref:Uncharacterized protein n=1 Tax=Alligator mississippiensis TaxID=8496 RepID=A0A151P091_ALLMI|nr:hypothetical protein Y1Q_0002711 [Alligator mississippiensis]